MHHTPPLMSFAIVAGVLAAFAVPSQGGTGPGARQPIRTRLMAILPAAVTMSLFFSLAIHMRSELGDWPRSLGTAGFSRPLAMHAELAQWSFGIVFLGTLLCLPVAALLCGVVPRWQRGLPSIRLCALACSICLGTTLLAPSEFLYWWWD